MCIPIYVHNVKAIYIILKVDIEEKIPLKIFKKIVFFMIKSMAQLRTMEHSDCQCSVTVPYSDVQCWSLLYSGVQSGSVEVSRNVQCGTVKVGERYSQVQLMYSKCQTSLVNISSLTALSLVDKTFRSYSKQKLSPFLWNEKYKIYFDNCWNPHS